MNDGGEDDEDDDRDHNVDDEEEEEREMDDEEDAYYNMDEEEMESAPEDVNNGNFFCYFLIFFLEVNIISGGDSNETAPVGQEDVSVELMDTAENPLENRSDETRTFAGADSLLAIGTNSGARPGVSGTTRQSTSGYFKSYLIEIIFLGAALNWAINRVRQEVGTGRETESASTGNFI